MLNKISRKIAIHIGNLLQVLNQKKIEKEFDPKSTYWDKRLELLKDAYDYTKVKNIEYFNLKYMLSFYISLFFYTITHLGVDE